MLSLPKHLYRTVARVWAMRPRCFGRLSMTFFWLFGFRLALAQQQPAPRVYTYVEQMLQLPDGGGQQHVAMELVKRIGYPAIDLRQQYTGSATVYFEVNQFGAVQHVKLLRATGSASVDSALINAAKKLPRFTPGYQNGKPVTVSFTMPFSCLKPQ